MTLKHLRKFKQLRRNEQDFQATGGRKIGGNVRCSFCCVAILVAYATNAVKIKPRKARSATPNLDSVASRHCKTQQQKQAKQIFQPPPPEHCFFCFYLPLNALILSSRSKYTKKRKRPENRQKQPNFRGLDFCLIFLLLRVHQSTRRDVKDCRQATSLLARSVLDSQRRS